MLLASYFSLPSSLCLIDPLKKGLRSLWRLLIFIVMALLPFFAEFRDGSYGLNTKCSSMEHPQCTCGRLVMPGLQMLTRRGTLELLLKEFWEFSPHSQRSLSAARLPTGQKSSDKDCFHLVITRLCVICRFHACLERLFDLRETGKTGQTKPIKHLEDLMML